MLEKGQTTAQEVHSEIKNSVRDDPTNNKAWDVGRGGCATVDGVDIPGQPERNTMVEQVSTLQPLDEPMPDQAENPCRNCDLHRGHAAAHGWDPRCSLSGKTAAYGNGSRCSRGSVRRKPWQCVLTTRPQTASHSSA